MESLIEFVYPSPSVFQFPPRNDPQALPPPAAGSTLSSPPFSIPSAVYNAALDVKVPVTIACVYAVTIVALNKYNKSRGNKAWPISKTRPFFWFVIAHNIFLAVYSAWTFVGMLRAIGDSIPSPIGAGGLVGTLDGFCKIHGTRGLGNAITYNPAEAQWISQSPETVVLSEFGTPDTTDVGRLWNEGLAFYGWFFYLSKFYEVFDTLIIIAKGKRSSTLQTYHHAGAMMCMWAGIRFMSPPIWLFVFLNSAIHAMMYTYYTLTAFSVSIPRRLKKSLTTLQICQFIIGVTYAATHSFISYTVPVQVLNVPTQAPSQKLNNLANTFRTEYQTIPCIDTSGQTFAIWLNVLYLAPLTVLFVRFFVKSYLRRSGKGSTYSTAAEKAEKAGKDALKGVGRELYTNGKPISGTGN